MTARRSDWPERLARFLEERKAARFVWGESDCALFAADWVLEATGEDPAATYRQGYDTRVGAIELLQERERFADAPPEAGALSPFGELLSAAVSARLNVRASPRQAQRGDVVAFRDPREEREIVLGICTGVFSVVLDIESGVQRLPSADALIAWEV